MAPLKEYSAFISEMGQSLVFLYFALFLKFSFFILLVKGLEWQLSCGYQVAKSEMLCLYLWFYQIE